MFPTLSARRARRARLTAPRGFGPVESGSLCHRSDHHPHLTGEDAQAGGGRAVGGEVRSEPSQAWNRAPSPMDTEWFQIPLELLCGANGGHMAGIPGGSSLKTEPPSLPGKPRHSAHCTRGAPGNPRSPPDSPQKPMSASPAIALFSLLHSLVLCHWPARLELRSLQ